MTKKHNWIINSILVIIIMVLLIKNISYKRVNSDLMQEKKILIAKTDSACNLRYRPVVVPKENMVNMGEEYSAAIYLAAINENNLPTVIVGEMESDKFSYASLTDTLEFNDEYDTYIYNKLPTKKGAHAWGGVIENKCDTSVEKMYFQMFYEVK